MAATSRIGTVPLLPGGSSKGACWAMKAARNVDSRKAPGRSLELLVSRRAMACDFCIRVARAGRGAIDSAWAALDEVERIESRLSVYLKDSALSQVNRSQGPATLDPELWFVLRAAVRLSHETGGAFNAAAGSLVRLWGFRGGVPRVPSPEDIAEALAAARPAFNEQDHTVSSGPEWNLGGIGKGYAVDRAVGILRRKGVGCALMHAGQSSLRAIGAPPAEPRGWAVDLAEAGPPVRVWLRDRALGTSGVTNRFFLHEGRRYGHVLDPRTGYPVDDVLSASVLAPTAMQADALSTAFFVLGVDGAREFCRTRPEIGAILVVPGEGREPRIEILGAADTEVLA